VTSTASADRPECRIVLEALEAANNLKVGMHRSDVERIFKPDGGMSVQAKGIFTYRGCQFIKIDVEFESREVKGAGDLFLPNDRIANVSKPYLAYPVTD
jgi:hypothetical protein